MDCVRLATPAIYRFDSISESKVDVFPYRPEVRNVNIMENIKKKIHKIALVDLLKKMKFHADPISVFHDKQFIISIAPATLWGPALRKSARYKAFIFAS